MFFQEPQSFLKALCKYLIATTPYTPYFGIYVIVHTQYSLISLERELEHGKFEGQKIIYITGLEIHILSNIITKNPSVIMPLQYNRNQICLHNYTCRFNIK